MSFGDYIEDNYITACSITNKFGHDTELIEALRNRNADVELVRDWMTKYAVFQGITGDRRDAVSHRCLEFAASHIRRSNVKESEIRTCFAELLELMYGEVQRTWISAASKFLWCVFPENICMYDKYVHRSLVVLQKVDKDLMGAQIELIGTTPKVSSKTTLDNAVDHYMNYQSVVKVLLDAHSKKFDRLRKTHAQRYLYDIRIIDKLLWMIGCPTQRAQ